MSAKSTSAQINHKGETAGAGAQETCNTVKAAPENSREVRSRTLTWPWVAEEVLKARSRGKPVGKPWRQHQLHDQYPEIRELAPDPKLENISVRGEEESEFGCDSGDHTVQGDINMDLDDLDEIGEISTDDDLDDDEDYDPAEYEDEYKGLTEDKIAEKWEHSRLIYLAQQMQQYGWRENISVDAIGAYVPSRSPAWPAYQKARGLLPFELELEEKQKKKVEVYTSVCIEMEEESLQPVYPMLENSPSIKPTTVPVNGIHEQDSASKQDSGPDDNSYLPVPDERPEGPTDTKRASPEFNRKFLTGALGALRKLRHASKDPTASPQLRAFVESLGDLKDIIQAGLDSLQSIFNNKVPSRLKDIYCLLHVAYAMSRVEKRAKDPNLPSKAFRQDLYVFRGCLPSQPESPDESLSPQDLFDEIIGIMWKEFEEGLKWVIPRLSKETSSFFDQRIAQTPAEEQTTRHGHRPNGIYMTFPKASTTPKKPDDVPKSLDMVTGTIAPEIDNDLIKLQRVVGTMVYQELVKTLSQLCHQQFAYLYWSGAIDGLLFWTESPDLLDLILTDNNAKGCMYCGNPYNLEGDCAPCKYLKTSLAKLQANGYLWLYNQVVTAVSRIMDLTVSGPLETPSPEPSDGELFQEFIDLASDSTMTFNPQPGMRRRRIGDTRSTNFGCPELGCSHKFARKQGLDRHIAQFHSPETVRTKIICGYRGCSAKRSQIVSATRGTRNDNMRTHMKTQHGFTEEQLRRWKTRYRGDEEAWEFD
ncbi:hypothetical protein TWF225_012007 [Orbilia oligospora]|uniref:C2H2-type domain-containing protein n=1 Tax=Orbilia oligospora TaxID=2813651 RepID=A0A8H2HPN6_ORBOL|nr:hypothetical protein TWF225_012007 [Orbilia oligospora]KAF3239017.1 hypothetical protein TWF128_011889 [Orbilia oligospora]KAF3244287.1 hypothetical protein TWF217_010788 [Orbilia oligospora]TGJ73979.1 hypothetical protein EYR41_001037 [Orbilia oligospora]